MEAREDMRSQGFSFTNSIDLQHAQRLEVHLITWMPHFLL